MGKVNYKGQEHIQEIKKKRDTVLVRVPTTMVKPKANWKEGQELTQGRTLEQELMEAMEGGAYWLAPPPHGIKAYCNTFDKYFSEQKT